jgi:hypothetical protein
MNAFQLYRSEYTSQANALQERKAIVKRAHRKANSDVGKALDEGAFGAKTDHWARLAQVPGFDLDRVYDAPEVEIPEDCIESVGGDAE